MPRFRNLNVIFGWGKLGRLGHRASIGFALPQLFREQLGQLGQICFRGAQAVLMGKMPRVFSICRTRLHSADLMKN